MRNAFPLSPSEDLPSETARTEPGAVPDLHVPLGRCGGLGGSRGVKGSRVLVSTLIAPRSPLLAQAAWPRPLLRCAHWVCFAARRQLLRNHSLRELSLLRRLGAARQCQLQCLTLLSHSPSLLSFREMYYGALSVGNTRVRHPYYSAVFYAGVQ